MFGIIRNACRGKKVKKLAMECETACLALDAQKARETYDRFLAYCKLVQRGDISNDEWRTWRDATRPVMSYLAPMVLALEGKPNGDPLIKRRMAEMRGEQFQISEAEFPQVTPELALRLADTRRWMFEQCVQTFELSGVHVLNRDLTAKADIELASFQFIHVDSALRRHKYLDETNVKQFLRSIVFSSYSLDDDDESQACANYLQECLDALMSLYDQEATDEEGGDTRLGSAFTLSGAHGFVADCLGFAIVGGYVWQTLGESKDLAGRAGELAGLEYMITHLALMAYWHTAVAFNDEKEIKRLEKEMQQMSESNSKE